MRKVYSVVVRLGCSTADIKVGKARTKKDARRLVRKYEKKYPAKWVVKWEGSVLVMRVR